MRSVNWVAVLVLVSGAWLAVAQAKDGAKATDEATGPKATVVTGEHLEQTSRCANNAPIRIQANNSRISVLGNCSRVIVEGSRNWILVDHANWIDLRGDLNNVLYNDRSTRVEDRGRGNSPSEHWQQ